MAELDSIEKCTVSELQAVLGLRTESLLFASATFDAPDLVTLAADKKLLEPPHQSAVYPTSEKVVGHLKLKFSKPPDPA